MKKAFYESCLVDTGVIFFVLNTKGIAKNVNMPVP